MLLFLANPQKQVSRDKAHLMLYNIYFKLSGFAKISFSLLQLLLFQFQKILCNVIKTMSCVIMMGDIISEKTVTL